MNTNMLSLILSILFLLMGIYGASSGRVYGRSWNKFLGGWIYRNSVDKGYYYSYTIMYFIVGIILLLVR